MKKIAFITTNKILAQSLDLAIKSNSDVSFDFFLFLNPNQALLDAMIFEIDVALIDATDSNIEKSEASFCEVLHKNLPNCHLLLLVSQDDNVSRQKASKAKKDKIIDDFVFYDASLKYLLAKLTAF